jgi:hypothetical protein
VVSPESSSSFHNPDDEDYSQTPPAKLIEIALGLPRPSDLYAILRSILLRLKRLDIDDPEALALREAYRSIDNLYEAARLKGQPHREIISPNNNANDEEFYRIVHGQFPDSETKS